MYVKERASCFFPFHNIIFWVIPQSVGVLLHHHNAGPLFHLITSQTDAQCCFDWTDTTAGSLFPAALKLSWLF